jgi:cytoplasmic iron level regulating protein YaaA (DUF328/UPF0246 family)
MSSCNTNAEEMTTPVFIQEAKNIALQMAQLNAKDLEKTLRINPKLGIENYKRFQSFFDEENLNSPAVFSYTGNVFKRIFPQDFTADELSFAQQHLLITSFLYGLLRPLDGIKLYRAEGDVRLYELGNATLFDYWKPKLTPFFIDKINGNGNTLINLASDEMKNLFNWKQVVQETNVITPEFKIYRNGSLKTIVIYAKMARGEMTRYIVKNKIRNPEEIKRFSWEGFSYKENLSDENNWIFTPD